MPVYTIETTYHLPVYRQCTYEAASVDEAANSRSRTMTVMRAS
jgi:hypothetical protein